MHIANSIRNLRTKYILSIVAVIIIGLLSRRVSFVPLWIGDFFYAVLIFFLVRLVFPLKRLWLIILSSLLFCYLIEISQLYHAPWIDDLRKTIFGRLVLGQGFLWSDIIAYTGGIIIAAIADLMFIIHHQKVNDSYKNARIKYPGI